MRSPDAQGLLWCLVFGMDAMYFDMRCAVVAVAALHLFSILPAGGDSVPMVSDRQQVIRIMKTMSMRGRLAMMANGVMMPKYVQMRMEDPAHALDDTASVSDVFFLM